MSLIVVSFYPERVEQWGHLWGEFEVFTPSAEGIPLAYKELTLRAVEEGWDETVRVQQDDVQVSEWPTHKDPITSASTRIPIPRPPRFHCCPRAFTASNDGWKQLTFWWNGEGQVCEAWRVPIKNIYNLTTHLSEGDD